MSNSRVAKIRKSLAEVKDKVKIPTKSGTHGVHGTIADAGRRGILAANFNGEPSKASIKDIEEHNPQNIDALNNFISESLPTTKKEINAFSLYCSTGGNIVEDLIALVA